MNENKFEFNAKTYFAKEIIVEKGSPIKCDGCSFDFEGSHCHNVPSCLGRNRKDGRNVIFVEKQI